MQRQKYSVTVQLQNKDIDITPHDVKEWFEELLVGKFQRLVGFSGESSGSFTYGDVITGKLVIEDEKGIESQEIAKYIEVPHDKWKVTEVHN